jgi:carbon storage regulator
MLVFHRHEGEKIMIGDDVEITVLARNDHGAAKIGITAPKKVAVHRREVWLRIKKQEAAEGSRVVPEGGEA